VQGDRRSFAQVVRKRRAPMVMVPPRWPWGWGRDGFGSGRYGRGAGWTGRPGMVCYRQGWQNRQEEGGRGRGGRGQFRGDLREVQQNPEMPVQEDDAKGKKVVEVQEKQGREGSSNQNPSEVASRENRQGADEGESLGAINQALEIADGGQGGRSGVGLELQQGVKGQAGAQSSSKMDDPIFCMRCKDHGHVVKDCRRMWFGDKGKQTLESCHSKPKHVSELVASLCAIQVDGQAFFVIPDRPSQL
jgi:hypothetical protein